MNAAFPFLRSAMAPFLFVALSGNTAGAIELCPRSDRYTCIVDGDTLWLDGVNYRLEGYDTPEPYTNVCGGESEVALTRQASARFMDLLNENDWSLQPRGRADRYGRVLASIYINGEDVGDILVREGLARYWPDGDEFWCN